MLKSVWAIIAGMAICILGLCLMLVLLPITTIGGIILDATNKEKERGMPWYDIMGFPLDYALYIARSKYFSRFIEADEGALE